MNTPDQIQVNEDAFVKVSITTPRGLIIELDADRIPAEGVREHLASGRDSHAAIFLGSLTGCTITIKRTQLTTCRKYAV